MADKNDALKRTVGGDELSYEDYLSAVFTYDDTCSELERAVIKAGIARERHSASEKKLNDARKLEAENREKYNAVIGAEAKNQRELWEKNQARFDVRLSQEKAVARMNAENDIQNKKDEFRAAVKNAGKNVDSLKKMIDELESEYEDLESREKSLDDFNEEDKEPADTDVLAFLQRAQKKKLLSPVQREMIESNVNTVCHRRLSRCEDHIALEKKLVSTTFYQSLLEGKVTDKIFAEFARSVSAVFTAFAVLVSLVLYAFQPNVFTMILHTSASVLSFGGLFASVTHVIREKYPKVRSLPVAERVMLIGMFVLGCVPGFFIGFFLFAPYRNVFTLLLSLIYSGACGCLLHRIMTIKLAKKYIGRITFLKDSARRDLFLKYENESNKMYSFMIFCYLCHHPVKDYLIMEKLQKERDEIQEKKRSNRSELEKACRELSKAESLLQSRESEKEAVGNYIKERRKRLDEQIMKIDSERPPEPDFIELAKNICAKDTEALEDEYELLSENTAALEEENAPLAEDDRLKSEREQRLQALKDRTENAIREWKKTPSISSRMHGLVDRVCIDSSSRITVIRHDLKPHVLYYEPKRRLDEPAETIKLFIFRYIRSLCKIDPRALMQVNIFDFVSEPHTLLDCRQFRGISDNGVIMGVYSTDKFEIRLFSDNSGCTTFFSVLDMQCEKIEAEYARFNEESDITFAKINKRRFAEKKTPFLYQICIFAVPRKEDNAPPPPKEVLALIKSGAYMKYGVLPVFIADHGSIDPAWKAVIGRFASCPHVFSLN